MSTTGEIAERIGILLDANMEKFDKEHGMIPKPKQKREVDKFRTMGIDELKKYGFIRMKTEEEIAEDLKKLEKPKKKKHPTKDYTKEQKVKTVELIGRLIDSGSTIRQASRIAGSNSNLYKTFCEELGIERKFAKKGRPSHA